MSTARELTTLGAAGRAFVESSSGRVITLAMLGAAVVRAGFGGLRWTDLATVAVVAAAVGPVEWLIHRTLLHAPPGRRVADALGTRDSHERHHSDPDDLEWLLLRRPNAIGSCLAIVMPIALLTAAVDRWAAAGATATVWGVGATGMVFGLLALLHYEWVHLLVHSRYRPTTRYYSRLDRNHRLHHFRNEQHWLGVTSNSGDRLFGTLPSGRSDVPLSSTVRTLDAPQP